MSKVEQLIPSVELPVVPEVSSVEADRREMEAYSKTHEDEGNLLSEEVRVLPGPTEEQVQAFEERPYYTEIENVLADGMFALYTRIPTEEDKARVKKEGERVAELIAETVRDGKVSKKDVAVWEKGLEEWLRTFPNIRNSAFITQEVKNKVGVLWQYSGSALKQQSLELSS